MRGSRSDCWSDSLNDVDYGSLEAISPVIVLADLKRPLYMQVGRVDRWGRGTNPRQAPVASWPKFHSHAGQDHGSHNKEKKSTTPEVPEYS